MNSTKSLGPTVPFGSGGIPDESTPNVLPVKFRSEHILRIRFVIGRKRAVDEFYKVARADRAIRVRRDSRRIHPERAAREIQIGTHFEDSFCYRPQKSR